MASLRDAQRAIVAALAQHASYAYRASSTVVNQLNREIEKLGQELAEKLYPVLERLSSGEKEAFLAGRYNSSALKQLKKVIEQHTERLDDVIQEIWENSAVELARYEAEYISEVLERAVDGLAKVTSDAESIVRKAKDTPVFGGELLHDLLSDAVARNEAQVYAAIRQGFADGQTNSEVVRALRGTEALRYEDGLMHRSKMEVERVVRTARNHIGNVAYEDVYEKLGVKYVVVVATLDGRTSKYCAAMDGTRYKVGEAFPRPPYHPNCLLGDSYVTTAGRVTNASKRWFDGEVLVIRTASGRELTCTPNHPILTSAGWIAAELVDQIGDVVSYRGGKWKSAPNIDCNNAIASIHDVTEAFFSSSQVTPSPVPVAAEHFHGDGGGSQIAIIGTNSKLVSYSVPILNERISKKQLVFGSSVFANRLPVFSSFNFGLKRISLAATSCMRFLHRLSNSFGRRCAGASALLLGAPSQGNTSPREQLANLRFAVAEKFSDPSNANTRLVDINNGSMHIVRNGKGFVISWHEPVPFHPVVKEFPTDVELSGSLQDGKPLEDVFVDKVVSVKRRAFAGHVYNLETEKGYYFANGIIVHNCRTILAPSFDDELVGNRPFVRSLKVRGGYKVGEDGERIPSQPQFRPIGKMTKAQREKAGLKVGQTKASTSYSKWFANQDAAFQREWLGPKRYKLYKEGGYDLSRFVDPRGRQYTLEELRRRDAETFRSVFGD